MNAQSISKSYPSLPTAYSQPYSKKHQISHYIQHINISKNHKILKIALIALAFIAVSFAVLAVLVLSGQLPHIFQQLGFLSAYTYLGLSILSSALFSYTAYYLATTKGIIDRYRLLQGPKTIDHSQQAWHLNAALLKEYYDQTDDPELKAEISFLINNYLSKISPLPKQHTLISWLLEDDYDDVGQTNTHLHTSYYHRTDCKRPPSPEIRKLNHQYALGIDNTLILTDTDQCQSLFSLHYHVINYDPSQQPNVENQLYTIFLNHFSKYPNALEGIKHKLEKIIIFDTTEYFKNCIKTDNESKKSIFKTQYQSYAQTIEQVIDRVAAQLNLSNTGKRKIIDFIKTSTLSLSRLKINQIGAIKVLPLFINFKNDSNQRWLNFLTFVDNTGLYIGAVNYRKHILHDISKLKQIQYVPRGQNTIYFETPTALFEKNIFKSLERAITDKNRPNYVSILGGAFLNLLKGLFNHVPDAAWQALMTHPQKQAIIQTSLFKIHDLLTTAHLFLNNYNKFTQTIELLHCELATLLAILSPFKQEQFEEIYKNVLKNDLPEDCVQYVHCGLGKASMNILAGVAKAVDDMNPHAVKTYSKGSYFEIVNFLGSANSFECFRQSDTPIDLYVGIINPNILVDERHTHYNQIDVAKDIREILNKNRGQPFTTVIDSTIDLINSPAIAALLKEFKAEIDRGELNIVIIRSGQKFDMFGNDHMFGTAYYTFHNNAPHWEPFKRIFTDELHRIDSLSLQWFCLAYKYAPDQLNAYCRQIFDNAKAILAHVPDRLKPKLHKQPSTRINTIDAKFEPAFIDIKITGKMHRLKGRYHMIRFFIKLHKDGNIKPQSRASFGFWQPNINIIWGSETCTTLRINPGLYENTNKAIIDYLQDF